VKEKYPWEIFREEFAHRLINNLMFNVIMMGMDTPERKLEREATNPNMKEIDALFPIPFGRLVKRAKFVADVCGEDLELKYWARASK